MTAEVTYLYSRHKPVPTRQANTLRSDKADILTGYLLMCLSAAVSCGIFTSLYFGMRGLFS